MQRIRVIWIAVLLTLFAGTAFAEGPAAGEDGNLVRSSAGICSVTAPRKAASLAGDLSKTCNQSAQQIFEQLGVAVDPQLSIQVRLVENPGEMQRLAPDANLPFWSHAVAFPEQNGIMLPLHHKDGRPVTDFEVVLDHELSHLAFRAASDGARVPRWFSEGVAILQSEGTSLMRKQSIWWRSMVDVVRPLSEIEKYPDGQMDAANAYAEAADFTAFLIEREGWNGIKYLLGLLKEGQAFDAAFAATYGMPLAVVEQKWSDGVFGSMDWLAVVTGTSALWGLMTILFVFAYLSVRKQKEKRLKEMEEEEKPVEQLISVIEEMEVSQRFRDFGHGEVEVEGAPTGKTMIEVDGEIHTLH